MYLKFSVAVRVVLLGLAPGFRIPLLAVDYRINAQKHYLLPLVHLVGCICSFSFSSLMYSSTSRRVFNRFSSLSQSGR